MNTMRGAYLGGIQGWNALDFIPSEEFGWDTYSARNSRYTINGHYYSNQAYASINTYVAGMIYQKKLYKNIRDVRNPSARIVDFSVSKVYPGALDMETAETGAIPLQADKRIRDAVIHYWDASNWNTRKNIYVRDGAIKGDTFIKNVNDPVQGSVYGEILNPAHVTDYKLDNQGLITYIVIEYKMSEIVNRMTRTWAYKEIIESDMESETHFATFKDNQPFAYFEDDNGKPIAEWDTDYGFVPVSLAQHTNMGLLSGACAFQTSIPKIDEINDAASLLNDQIRNAVQIAFLMPGTSAPKNRDGSTPTGAEITYDRDAKTNIPIIHAGKDATAIPLIADINIADALKNIESLEAGLERENPVLAMYKLWDAQQISGVAVSKLYDPVVAIIKLARSNYDSALVNAQQQAIAMGASHGYAEYRTFAVTDYWTGALKHTIKDRSVFDDTIERQAKITTLMGLKDTPSEFLAPILKELDMTEKEIKDIVDKATAREEMANEAAARAFMQTALNGDDNGDETTQDTEQQSQNRPAKPRQLEDTRVP